jgi:VacB/RNase II family 3'-5' exoribonuclease
MNDQPPPKPFDLAVGARRAMLDNGFAPDFPEEALRELEALAAGAPALTGLERDLRGLCWSSIDNRESRDLDQIEAAERLDDGSIRILVGVADVDAFVRKGSALDAHALKNSASVYTGAVVFPMLPDRLSTDLSSLNQGEDRPAVVIEFVVGPDGEIVSSDVSSAIVRSRAQLVYHEIAEWLDGAPPPEIVAASPELAGQLRLQDAAAQKLKALRQERGALDLETIEARPVAVDGRFVDLTLTGKNRARDMIEDFMISANGVMARFLAAKRVPSIRRVVRAPERWQRLCALAAGLGDSLPAEPDSVALAGLLARRKAAAPDHFADFSLAVVKLMGPGEYALDRPGSPSPGHFGLAVQDYTHSTAPNRRYADLVTQRLVKAAITGAGAPYSEDELAAIALHCTLKENDARKVERTTRKEAAALLLADRIGETFDAIVTGVSSKGTFVRLLHPPAEGRVVRGEQGVDVGDRFAVTLLATEPSRGFIDFAKA